MNPFDGQKLLRWPDRVAYWATHGHGLAPISVELDLTDRCGHDCPACSSGRTRTDDTAATMPKATAMALIDELAAFGVRAVVLIGGGDPLMHPNAPEIIRHAADTGLSVGVVTNGQCLKSAAREAIAGHAEWVRISLDAATPQTWARVHGMSADRFQEHLDNIRAMAEHPNRKAVVGIGMLVDDRSLGEVYEAARLARDLGADYIQFRPFNGGTTDASTAIRTAKEELDSDSFTVNASWNKYDLIVGGVRYVKPYSQCYYHEFSCVIRANGCMHICCDMRCPAGLIGDVTKRGFAAVWKQKTQALVNERIGDMSGCPPLCKGNSYNLLLDQVVRPKMHEEFL